MYRHEFYILFKLAGLVVLQIVTNREQDLFFHYGENGELWKFFQVGKWDASDWDAFLVIIFNLKCGFEGEYREASFLENIFSLCFRKNFLQSRTLPANKIKSPFLPFPETSAKTRDGVQCAFEELVAKILETPGLCDKNAAKQRVQLLESSVQRDKSVCGAFCPLS